MYNEVILIKYYNLKLRFSEVRDQIARMSASNGAEIFKIWHFYLLLQFVAPITGVILASL